jgi:hypothetical protein
VQQQSRTTNIHKINRGRKFIRKFIINSKEVLIRFEEDERGETEIDFLLEFETLSVLIVGKTKRHSLLLGKEFTHQTTATSNHLHYTQEEIEEFIEQDVEKIKELIISIDNF